MQVRLRHIDQADGAILGEIEPTALEIQRLVALLENHRIGCNDTGEDECPVVDRQFVLDGPTAYLEIIVGSEPEQEPPKNKAKRA